MLNRRKKNIMDPKRISNYNKFLCTLDQTSSNLVKLKFNNLKSEIDVKNEIDNIIDRINNNFKISEHASSKFTGQNSIDNCCINNQDPNYYRDVINSSRMLYYTQTNQTTFKEDKPKQMEPTQKEELSTSVEIRETINIDVEINDITDILKLIDIYQNDPSIKYNINMKALHDIREPLEQLNNMIGMVSLKSNIVDQILYFVQELHKSNLASGDFMHTVIYGQPGTGKTEIAKIMGKIYSKIGILKKGTFKKVTRSDMIAGYLGQTALKTRDVIKEALGGVLFIDEAYSLGSPDKKDSFSKECIDTLCEALSDNKEELMVIIAGYEKELKECFFNYNQGLDSRFTWRFKTDDYTGEDLYKIFLKKVKDIGWEIDTDSTITVEWFKKNKDYFKFYGRDIETILAKTKIAHSRRVFCRPESEKKKINQKDLDKGFEIYLKNEDVKNRKEKMEMEKYLYSTLYS
jgi:SpoVK/Ycf46/Vps4 family AAA+-type ATPase